MDTPGSRQPPKKTKRDPEKSKQTQKLYRQRLYAAVNGIEDVKAIHRQRYHERMTRMKANGEYEAFKAKKTSGGRACGGGGDRACSGGGDGSRSTSRGGGRFWACSGGRGGTGLGGCGGDGGSGDGGWRCHGGGGGGGGGGGAGARHGWERERIQGIVYIDRVGQIEIVNVLLQSGTIHRSRQFGHHVRHAAEISENRRGTHPRGRVCVHAGC